jgi:TatD DNase family protein
MFIDTHAHLCFPELKADLPAVIARAGAAGVTRIISIATNLADARETLGIAERFPGVYAAVGLHPGSVPEVSLTDVPALRELAGNPRVVAIGETGLDYYREAKSNDALRRQQKDLLWAQLELAKELVLPVIIHNRASDADLLEILRAHSDGLPKEWRPWGVMHCFGGDEKFAFDCLEIGLLISYTGILTFKNAELLRDVAKKVPLSSVMLETDAPYLAPVPHRGKTNEPAYVPFIAEVLAQLKDVPVAEVAAATTANAQRLFKLSLGI